MKTRLLTTFVALLATVFGASAATTTDEPVTDGSSIKLVEEGKADKLSSDFTAFNSEVTATGTPKITSVSVNVTMGLFPLTIPLPDQSVTQDLPGTMSTVYLNSFTAKTSGEVTELYMEYAIRESGSSGDAEKKQVFAKKQSDGKWVSDMKPINGTEGLKSNTKYSLELSFSTNVGSNGQRAHFPSDGKPFAIGVTTGNLPTEINVISVSPEESENVPAYDISGRRVGKNAGHGLIIKSGKKYIAR